MKLYFVRHGKTLWNLEGRFQGASGDSPLLDEAKNDIRAVGKRLAKIPFDAVYSSDLQRAVTTTGIILKEIHNPPTIDYTDQLREWQLGRLEGEK